MEKKFSVGSSITSSAFAVTTPPPANSNRCSPSTFLGLLLSRENGAEPDGATSPVRKTLKTTYRTMSAFSFFDGELFYRFQLSILSCCWIFAWSQITNCWCSLFTISPLRSYGKIYNRTVALRGFRFRTQMWRSTQPPKSRQKYPLSQLTIDYFGS